MTDVPDSTLSYADGSEQRPRLVRSPYLVLALEAMRPLGPSGRWFLSDIDQVVIGRAKKRAFKRAERTLEIRVPDGWMSSIHATLTRESDGWILRDSDSKNGSFVRGRRITKHKLRDGDQFAAGNTMFLFFAEGQRPISSPVDSTVDGVAGEPLATLNPELGLAFDDLRRVARSTVPVIVLGESGTGKEVMARAVHDLSGRNGQFVAINCGALPDNLIESELFGYRKGAFSGATEDRKGLVRAADRGTLFLDEIAELPETSQTKLLRVLQEGTVVPLGGTQPVNVDIRVIAATHQDLTERTEDQRFRKDLYARLSGFEFMLPALRDRREDVGFLTSALLSRAGADESVQLERGVVRRLLDYDWPLNVRELEQAINASLALAAGEPVAPQHLPAAIRGDEDLDVSAEPDDPIKVDLIEALRRNGGNVSAVARDLGKARVQIRRWCKRFAIDPDSFRD